MRNLLLFSLAIFLLGSCSSEMREKLDPRPEAFGPLNQLAVIADEVIWESPVGDTFDYYFASAYPILPQPEPIYDLRYFTPDQLYQKKERRSLRRYVILANLTDTASQATKLIYRDISPEKIEAARNEGGFRTAIATDRWADNQLVVYMYGFSHDQLIENIQTNFRGIDQRIRQSETGQIEDMVYPAGINGSLVATLNERLGVDVRLPSDYQEAFYDDVYDMVWVRQDRVVRDGEMVSTNIMFRKIPYEQEEQLLPEYLQEQIDSLGAYVSSEIENTSLVVNDVDLPIVTEVFQRDSRYTLQMRGIWEMENDFMGGPFLAEMALNPNTNELLLTFGFIFAPSQDKRDFMKFLEHVVATADF
jgi:hypothetical protein